MAEKRVVVIGCGAAGMMAAIAAAHAGAKVTVLESQKTPGKKLLLTGNSRCNLTNLAPRPEMEYQSTDEEDVLPLVTSVFGQFSVQRTLDLFHRMGLLTMTEHHTYVYPVTGQSLSVLNVLIQQMKETGVRLKYSEKAVSIVRILGGSDDPEEMRGRWIVRTEGWHYQADSVILAAGGRSFPQTGSDGSGYRLAESLSLKVTDTVPALTGISVRSGKLLAPLAGLRMNAGVSVWIDGVPAARDIGQLQFTATDLSGIVAFQVSRKVSRALEAGRHVEIRLDLIPNFTEDEVETLITHYGKDHPDAPLKMAFCGLLPHQLIPVVLKAAGVLDLVREDSKASDMDKKFIRTVSGTIKSFRLEASKVRGFDSCQVTAGGVDLSEVDPSSLECKAPGLDGIYLAGEILDVDGPCGGYNLQWAWSSGYVAGIHAAQ